jgi:hypothetical protein
MDEKRIKDMYNEGAVAFKKYCTTHNIAQFTDDAAEICKRYGNDTVVCGLMLWWSARVNEIHQGYIGGVTNGRN